MGKDRKPSYGSWSVFEGDTTHRPYVVRQDIPSDYINDPIAFPVMFRIHRITEEGIATGIDIEIDDCHGEWHVTKVKRTELDVHGPIDTETRLSPS